MSFDHWNTRADAVTMVDGIALRVPGGIPGETADVEVIAQSRGGPVAWARLIDITSPSPDRREPPCALEGTCGGCGLQHVDGGRFARVVQSALREAPELAAVLAPPDRWIQSAPWGWRHKAVLLPARRKGALQLGGYARGSHDVVDLPSCGVLAPGLRHARAGLLARLGVHRKLPLSPPGDAVKPGALRSLILETAAGTPGVGPLEETLKWGQISYLTTQSGSGTTIRLDMDRPSGQAALYVNCKTDLVSRFRTRYPESFAYQGDRAVILPREPDVAALQHIIALALTYHRRNI